MSATENTTAARATAPFDIREATAADWPGIWAVLEPVLRTGETFTWDRDTTEEQARAKWMKEAPGQTFVAVRDGVVLGTGEFHANQGGGGSHVANAGYMVGAAYSGQGIARALCAYSLDAARATGFRAMQFNAVVESNTTAVWLWQSMLPDPRNRPGGLQPPRDRLRGAARHVPEALGRTPL
ncbi:GNAT family N-acetyltransferase [Arthrobacter cavernae]|uniref:GNAT family N-acetyltransferase n=1 Tax=Arthrobacter cavernae TaxID=2817681 RepID=UPI0027DCEA74|nr:GNAT family N-acetyltransferase [Arthrobacter cavernae]